MNRLDPGEEAEEDVSRQVGGNELAPYGVRVFFSSSILRIRSITQQTADIIRVVPRQTSRLVSSISQQTIRIMRSIHHGIDQCFSLGARNLATMETGIQVALETGRSVVYGVRSFLRSSILMLRVVHQGIELRVALFVHNTEALSYLTLRYAGVSPDVTNRFLNYYRLKPVGWITLAKRIKRFKALHRKISNVTDPS